MNIQVVLLKNKRLNFNNSEIVVVKFIENRLKTIGLTVSSIVDSRESFFQLEKDKDSFKVLVDVMNPFVDLDLIVHCHNVLKKSNKIKELKPVGCVPGTEFEIICRSDLNPTDGQEGVIHWETQSKFNNQFNLYKYKRLKMFLGLIEKFPNVVNLSISELNLFIEQDDVFHYLLSYATDEEVVFHDECQHCGEPIEKLHNTSGHPFIGYIPSSRSIYSRCLCCGLIFLNPSFSQESIPSFYDLFDREDFANSLNSSYHENNERCNLDYLKASNPGINPAVLDLGGGMGLFSKYIKTTYPNFQVNHSDFEIKAEHDSLKELGVNTITINFLEEQIAKNSYDLITMWEVIEHIPFSKLDDILKNVWNALKPNGFFTFSTPDFDSPLARVLDFYYACPPFHLTCFSKSWLESYFLKQPNWKIHRISYSSDLMDDLGGWSSYASRFAPGDSSRSLFKIINEMISGEKTAQVCRSMLDKNIGTEVIFILQKV